MAFFFKVYKKTFDNFRLQKKIHFFCAILKHQSEAWRCCHNICKSLEIFWDQQEKIALFMFRFFLQVLLLWKATENTCPAWLFFRATGNHVYPSPRQHWFSSSPPPFSPQQQKSAIYNKISNDGELKILIVVVTNLWKFV